MSIRITADFSAKLYRPERTYNYVFQALIENHSLSRLSYMIKVPFVITEEIKIF
jgi:hypothetical protein